MNFQPKSEKEIADSRLLPRGVYDFEILDAWEKTAQSSGNPMIELQLRVSNPKGQHKILSDYLTAARVGDLREAALACGLLEQYDSGSLDADAFKGKQGRCKVGIEKGKNGYHDKNIVAEYLKTPEGK